MDALGHVDYDYDKRMVYSCDPYLVLLPQYGLPQALLTGARNVTLITQLKKYVAANRRNLALGVYPQPVMEPFLPAAIYLEGTDIDALAAAAKYLNINCSLDSPASWAILGFSEDIQKINDKLRFEFHEEINWQTRLFSVQRLAFTSATLPRSDMRLVEYTDPRTREKMHLLWNDHHKTEVNRDWGRYLLLRNLGVNVVYYDPLKYLFLVPRTVPLPILITRAITLCTGLVPKSIDFDNRQYLVYSSIEPKLAKAVAEKIGQSLREISVTDSEN